MLLHDWLHFITCCQVQLHAELHSFTWILHCLLQFITCCQFQLHANYIVLHAYYISHYISLNAACLLYMTITWVLPWHYIIPYMTYYMSLHDPLYAFFFDNMICYMIHYMISSGILAPPIRMAKMVYTSIYWYIQAYAMLPHMIP